MDALNAVIDPGAIILGGELPRKLGEMFLAMPRVSSGKRWNISAEYPDILLSTIEGDSSALGAALTPLRETYFN